MDYNADSYLALISLAEVEEMKFVGKDIEDLIKALKSKETNPDNFAKDMTYLVTISCVRGTNLSKISDRSTPEVKRKFETLVKKYGIISHAKAVPMKTPTLPRIVSMFPMLIAKVRITYPSQVSNIGESVSGLPKQFWFPGGGALMDDKTLPIWLEWYETFCKVVGITYNVDNASLSHKFSRVLATERFSM